MTIHNDAPSCTHPIPCTRYSPQPQVIHPAVTPSGRTKGVTEKQTEKQRKEKREMKKETRALHRPRPSSYLSFYLSILRLDKVGHSFRFNVAVVYVMHQPIQFPSIPQLNPKRGEIGRKI